MSLKSKGFRRSKSNQSGICLCCQHNIINRNKNAYYCKGCARYLILFKGKYNQRIYLIKRYLKKGEVDKVYRYLKVDCVPKKERPIRYNN